MRSNDYDLLFFTPLIYLYFTNPMSPIKFLSVNSGRVKSPSIFPTFSSTMALVSLSLMGTPCNHKLGRLPYCCKSSYPRLIILLVSPHLTFFTYSLMVSPEATISKSFLSSDFLAIYRIHRICALHRIPAFQRPCFLALPGQNF